MRTIKKLHNAEHNIFFYMIRGEVTVNSTKAKMLQLVEFAE